MKAKSFLYFVFCFLLFNDCFSKSTRGKHERKKHDCPYPVLKQNGTDMAIDIVGFLSGIAEIKFNGAFGKMESKRYCKIKCINGEWVGPLCLVEGSTETSGDPRYHPVLRSCSSSIFHSNFVLSFQNRTITTVRDFPHNSVVQVRCKRFGIYKLIGDAHLTCHNGVWKHRIPTCIPTSSLSNFTDESAPPSIIAKVTSGSASIEPTGELAVYPGSTVHLECLHLRSFGEPEWSWTSMYRTYTTGWSIDSEERNWKYRLSIYYIKPQDTGIYTCSTPKGLTHSIILNVIEVHCEVAKVLTNDPNLLTQIQGSRLGQSTTFQCREGFKLNGSSTITCQASGVWSGYSPQCIPVVCPELEVKNDTVKLVKQDFGYGGMATFQCPFGQKLVGVGTLVCLINGEWSGNIPTCKEVFCPPPLIPHNGNLEYSNNTVSFPFRVGAELMFSCKGPYKLIGKESIKCQDTGVWSSPPPFCKAQCIHPGDPNRGRFTPRKAEYDVGDRITLTCSNGFEPTTKVKPKCQKNGSWSENGLKCVAKKTFKLTGRKSENTIILSNYITTRMTPLTTTPRTTTTTSTPVPTTTTTTSTTTTTTTTTPATTIYLETPKKYTTNPVEPITSPGMINVFYDDFNDTQTDTVGNDTDFFYVIEEQPL